LSPSESKNPRLPGFLFRGTALDQRAVGIGRSMEALKLKMQRSSSESVRKTQETREMTGRLRTLPKA